MRRPSSCSRRGDTRATATRSLPSRSSPETKEGSGRTPPVPEASPKGAQRPVFPTALCSSHFLQPALGSPSSKQRTGDEGGWPGHSRANRKSNQFTEISRGRKLLSGEINKDSGCQKIQRFVMIVFMILLPIALLIQ